MCVSQFRDFTRAFSFKRRADIDFHDVVQTDRETFYANRSEWVYVRHEKQMKQLAKLGNSYAINCIKGDKS